MDPSESVVLKNLSNYALFKVLVFKKYLSHMELFTFIKIMLGKLIFSNLS